MRSVRPGIHLPGTIALALDNPIAKACSEISRAIGASTICDNDFGSGRSLAKVREKSPYQGRLIENRNNDRKLHCLTPLANRFFLLRIFPAKIFTEIKWLLGASVG
jgi:hypothetical protein